MTIVITDTPTVAPLVPGAAYLNLPLPVSTPWGKAQHTDIIMWGLDDTGRPVPLLWKVQPQATAASASIVNLPRGF